MIDWCYLHEKPLPEDVEQVAKFIRMREHCTCIAGVLQEFFVLKNDGYHNARIDAELKEYKNLSNKRKKAANKRWATAGKTSKGDASALQVESKSNAKHEPLTKNHKPLTNTKRFAPPTLEEVKAYCFERRNSVNPEQFIDYYSGNGWMRGKNKIKDWKACVRTWERNENDRRSQQPSKPIGGKPSLAERSAEQTAIIQARIAAGEFDQRPMGQNGAALPTQMEFSGRGEDQERTIDAEFFDVVPQNGGFN